MNTGAAIAAIIVIIVIVGAAYYFLVPSTTPGPSGSSSAKTVFTYSDAGASAVSSVNMQVSSVQMQNSANGQWYTATMVSNGGNVKLQGQGSYTVIGNVSAPAGTYSNVQMVVSSATVTYVNGTTKTAAMPNSTIRMAGSYAIQSTANTSSTNWINFDINSAETVHTTSSGQAALFPVVQVIAWSGAQLSTGANNMANVQSAGTVTAQNSAGMNINGSMQTNFVLPQTTNITVSGTGVISIG